LPNAGASSKQQSLVLVRAEAPRQRKNSQISSRSSTKATKLKDIDKKAATAAQKEDAKSRADYLAALNLAKETVTAYRAQVRLIEPAFVKKFQAVGTFSILKQNLEKIGSEIDAAKEKIGQ